ncbi:hypothetical protein A6V39_02020 [Candidatus Mycoplasma haematobovis]|uniref:DNA polymerase III subunit gamma/tau n=1 Tax=Candidatus Mycoplasma haematobovis TaxID=432608 RepID=A0A1A9QE33_9MOLU|nr:DNA polymerase III subunit gamma/tau [Candidatus Mycoplasma haematobovis]OAL10205.1 hypothetical protein A6V39_02020 [Candidatus Mycoplasma haematobovis]
MSEINLYNKYRPKKLSEIIGQETIKKLITQTFSKNKLLQSFIFYGFAGTGKTTTARIFAKAWNCINFNKEGDVCDGCDNCKLIEENKTTDIYEIDAASKSGVDNMRELVLNSQYPSLHLLKKIYIIDEAHNLSKASWDVLLKVIEEPPENVIFLFLTTNIHKIPETIISRCQKYNFSRLSQEELCTLMERVCEGEGCELAQDAKERLSQLAGGSARECLTLLEQALLSFSQNITLADIEKVFSLASKKELLRFVELVITNKVEEALKFLEEFNQANKNFFNYYSDLFTVFIDLFTYKKTNNEQLMKRLDISEIEGLLNGPFLEYLGVMEERLSRYLLSHNKYEWAQFTLFKLMEHNKVEATIEVKKEFPKEKTFQIEFTAPSKVKLVTDLEKKILFGFKSSSKSISQENYMIYQKLLESDKIDERLLDLFKKISQRWKLLSSQRTIIVVFSEDLDVIKFNELAEEPEIKQFLDTSFFKEYLWIALNESDFNKYLELARTKTNAELAEDVVFDSSRKSKIFRELMEILESN